MKWSLSAVIMSLVSPGISGFIVSKAHTHTNAVNDVTNNKSNGISANELSILARHTVPLNRRNMASVDTETDHDTVTVDLADGRDYPIYIGANFDDKQGMYF